MSSALCRFAGCGPRYDGDCLQPSSQPSTKLVIHLTESAKCSPIDPIQDNQSYSSTKLTVQSSEATQKLSRQFVPARGPLPTLTCRHIL